MSRKRKNKLRAPRCSPWQGVPSQGSEGRYRARYLYRSGTWQVWREEVRVATIQHGHFRPHHLRDPAQRGRKLWRAFVHIPAQIHKLQAVEEHPSLDAAMRWAVATYEARLADQMEQLLEVDWELPIDRFA